jgi:hypothetical protein
MITIEMIVDATRTLLPDAPDAPGPAVKRYAHNRGVNCLAEATAMTEPRTKRDPEGTRRRILEAATQRFSTYGLSGARVDAIATAADTNERMLYYYFESKEGL